MTAPLGDAVCMFWVPRNLSDCSTEEGRAVTWLANGLGACGAHHQQLARLAPMRKERVA